MFRAFDSYLFDDISMCCKILKLIFLELNYLNMHPLLQKGSSKCVDQSFFVIASPLSSLLPFVRSFTESSCFSRDPKIAVQSRR